MALGESVDGRADLYALGCVAYYLLTGQVVFDADTPFQMIARHLRAEPVPPSRRTERPVPPALERLVLDCLAKEADDRPQSAAELGRSLAAIEIEPWDDEQAMRWWKGRSPVADPIPGGN
jgi:serine/threonine-protein kinase